MAWKDVEVPEECDDLVIGAGSSGAVIARRICEGSARRVMLLEAGPVKPAEASAERAVLDGNQPAVLPGINWKIQARIKAEAPRAAPARGSMGSVYTFEGGRLVGGSSAVNSALACRGAPQDYDEWAADCGEEWGWSGVLPFFRLLEDDPLGPTPLHGRGGPMPIRRAAREELRPLQAGLLEASLAHGFPACEDHNDPETTGVGMFPKNVVDGVRMSTKLCYLDPVRDRPNLRIVPDALVRRLLWSTSSRCSGAELEVAGAVRTVRAERVIVCAGAINSPLILMRSGIGAPKVLEGAGVEVRVPLPGVGEGLMDHPVVGIWGIPRPEACTKGEPARQVLLRYTSRGSARRNDMHICTMAGIDVAELFPQLASTTATIAGFLVVYNRSTSRGFVRITSPDPQARANVSISCLSDARDVAPLEEGVRLAWKLMNHPALRAKFERLLAWTPQMIESDAALEQAVKAFVRPAAHLGSSARMGRSPDAGAVVDPRGRVHGVDNVWVADMSIAPMVPSAPPHLTCLMIAEKIAAGLQGGAAA